MTRLQSLCAEPLAIPFRVAFKHAAAERTQMQSLWVQARSARGAVGLGEGCPRDYVSGESLASALGFVERHRDAWLAAVVDLPSLAAWAAAHRDEIDTHPAAWSAVELALLDVLGQDAGLPLEPLLGLPPLAGAYRYSAVLGDAPQAAYDAQLARYLDAGFADFKIKLSGVPERDRGKVRALAAAGIAPSAVRADANNLWDDAAVAGAHLEALDFPFGALEEPLRPGDIHALRALSKRLGTPIILDESVLRIEQLAALQDDAERWIVNLRISKMGGMLRSLAFVREARRLGVRLVIGAHVGETSVLTRAGLAVAAAAADLLVAQEGAFGSRLLERDPVAPSLMFGPGGVLDLARHAPLGNGLGLRAAPAAGGD